MLQSKTRTQFILMPTLLQVWQICHVKATNLPALQDDINSAAEQLNFYRISAPRGPPWH